LGIDELPSCPDPPPKNGEDDAYAECLAEKPTEETLLTLRPELEDVVRNRA